MIEADRVTSDWGLNNDPREIDGIRMDSHGNPVSYRVLRHHPGGKHVDFEQRAVEVPAESVVHQFRGDRPELHRGVPEITPALPLFAQLRRYTLAVLAAAEAAADFAGIIYTDAPANGEASAVAPGDLFELERNMMLTLPSGWKMDQLNPAHPSSTYAEFKKEILNEIARCLNIPFNIAAGNSSGYNYASGRLDHQTYYKAVGIDQHWTGAVVLDRILAAWLREWALLNGEHVPGFTHQWFWDGLEHVDPAKEANAQKTRLDNNTTTLAREYARQGLDWEAEIEQRAREKKLLKRVGLTEDEAAPAKAK